MEYKPKPRTAQVPRMSVTTAEKKKKKKAKPKYPDSVLSCLKS
jgi:hypothetical protein